MGIKFIIRNSILLFHIILMDHLPLSPSSCQLVQIVQHLILFHFISLITFYSYAMFTTLPDVNGINFIDPCKNITFCTFLLLLLLFHESLNLDPFLAFFLFFTSVSISLNSTMNTEPVY